MLFARRLKFLAGPVLGCVFAGSPVPLATLPAHGAISVAVGPTTIPRGDARGQRDITISNGVFAIALAVDSAPPWGVARGGIVDIALLRDGAPGPDIASLADFMPNNWSSWPTSYQRVEIEKQTAGEVVIRSLRDWGEVELETRFHVGDGHSAIHIVTRMTNRGKTPLAELLSGYVLWPDGGYLFNVPGLPPARPATEEAALADWSAAYADNWALGLHAPFASHSFSGGRDRYLRHALQPGASATFEAWLQIEPAGALAPLVATEIVLGDLPSGRISGKVGSGADGDIAAPALVVLKNGRPYTWAIGEAGRYAIELPAGDYEIYATAAAHGRSASRRVAVQGGGKQEEDFSDIGAPGAVDFEVIEKAGGAPLDARISILRGYKPLIEYFGKHTFFTELEAPGQTRVELAPGDYEFSVSAGAGFTSLPQRLPATVAPGESQTLTARIPVQLAPAERGWYSADLHHHSDVLDGFTEPAYVLRSELASGVDIAFLSDHDAVVNNAEMQRLSARRGLPFIAGTELSPSWAHFNAYPLEDGREISIDVGAASVQAIFAQARALGAEIVSANHPYGDYGYFYSLERDAVPGGFDTGFDLVEITAGNNQDTMTRVWQLWNEGRRFYLAAGSDVHDVWNEVSGAARSYVKIEGEPTVAAFVAALKQGHAFASQGPLVFPDLLFGSELAHVGGAPLELGYAVRAVSGLRSVRLIGAGRELRTLSFVDSQTAAQVEFKVTPKSNTWYALVVEDEQGRFAYTNPIWVTVQAEPKTE